MDMLSYGVRRPPAPTLASSAQDLCYTCTVESQHQFIAWSLRLRARYRLLIDDQTDLLQSTDRWDVAEIWESNEQRPLTPGHICASRLSSLWSRSVNLGERMQKGEHDRRWRYGNPPASRDGSSDRKCGSWKMRSTSVTTTVAMFRIRWCLCASCMTWRRRGHGIRRAIARLPQVVIPALSASPLSHHGMTKRGRRGLELLCLWRCELYPRRRLWSD
jgi:hypothetical protein